MRKLRWMAAVLLALAMLAAACGSDSDDSSTEAAEEPAAEEPAAEEPAAEEPAAEEPAEEPAEAGGEVTVDVGVDDETIKIGLLTDLTGAFAPLTVPITDGTEAYFEWVNANGGIAGRQVEVITLDTGYDVPTHQQQYDQVSGSGADGVVLIGTSTGSPHTASIRSDLVNDGLAAIPLTWNSSWPDPASSNVFEWTSNYCVEAMNGVTYMSETYGDNVAVLSWPGDYGEDGAIGAKYAAEQLGLNLVYDGQGAQAPTSDPTPVIAEIIAADPDFVWLTTNPTDAAAIIGGAAAAGYTGQWAGNGPTYNPALLGVEGVSTVFDSSYTHFQPYPAWDTGGSDGMAEIVGIMQEFRPDAALLSVYINSYIMGEIARQGLEAAAASGDMTRQGVLDALGSTEIDLKGLASPINHSGDPNDFIARETFIFDISLDAYTPGATVGQGGSDGAVLIEGNFTSPTAAEWEYAPCFPI